MKFYLVSLACQQQISETIYAIHLLKNHEKVYIKYYSANLSWANNFLTWVLYMTEWYFFMKILSNTMKYLKKMIYNSYLYNFKIKNRFEIYI